MASRLVISLIHCYRWFISPFLPSRCRFNPTCSRYAIHAVNCYGVVKGLYLAIKRLIRCRPYFRASSNNHAGKTWGYDPVEKTPFSRKI